jgi:DNA invertase Pin-like site-specific DNA recombinase
VATKDPIQELKAERLQRRLRAEEAARELGEKHAAAKDELASVIQSVTEILPQALEAGVPLDTYSKLVGVSRQTLYRWQDTTRRKREAEKD